MLIESHLKNAAYETVLGYFERIQFRDLDRPMFEIGCFEWRMMLVLQNFNSHNNANYSEREEDIKEIKLISGSIRHVSSLCLWKGEAFKRMKVPSKSYPWFILACQISMKLYGQVHHVCDPWVKDELLARMTYGYITTGNYTRAGAS